MFFLSIEKSQSITISILNLWDGIKKMLKFIVLLWLKHFYWINGRISFVLIRQNAALFSKSVFGKAMVVRTILGPWAKYMVT